MSDSPASSFAESAPRHDAPVLNGLEEHPPNLDRVETEPPPGSTPFVEQADLESALADFRRWFAEATQLAGGPPPTEVPPTIDLATLLGHFVALRQEINLQTRAVRAQQEQTSDVVVKFQQSLELAQRSQTRAEQAERQGQDEKLRPLLGTLADLYDSLATAASQIRRVTSTVLPRLQELHEETQEEAHAEVIGSQREQSRSFWSRWILSPSADEAIRANLEQARQAEAKIKREREERQRRAEQNADACAQVQDALSALLSGYTMNLERIERSLRKHQLEPIEAVGTPFDPDRMESLDGVTGTGRPHNEVVEEIQRGYTINGKVFRYARVRVARN